MLAFYVLHLSPHACCTYLSVCSDTYVPARSLVHMDHLPLPSLPDLFYPFRYHKPWSKNVCVWVGVQCIFNRFCCNCCHGNMLWWYIVLLFDTFNQPKCLLVICLLHICTVTNNIFSAYTYTKYCIIILRWFYVSVIMHSDCACLCVLLQNKLYIIIINDVVHGCTMQKWQTN